MFCIVVDGDQRADSEHGGFCYCSILGIKEFFNFFVVEGEKDLVITKSSLLSYS